MKTKVIENPLAPYFDIEDQNGNFKFTPTETWRKLKQGKGFLGIHISDFIMQKKYDTVRLSFDTEETQPLTPTWKYRDGKWRILAVSKYAGCIFDGHIKSIDDTCPRCGYRLDDDQKILK